MKLVRGSWGMEEEEVRLGGERVGGGWWDLLVEVFWRLR